MFGRRLGVFVAVGLATCSVALDSACARRLHRHHVTRHHVIHRGADTFVFRSPDAATVTANAGKAGGFLGDTGIMGATTADPYEHPGYGYYVGGGRGPGYYYSD